jgi:AcrR family transcriptional regulator
MSGNNQADQPEPNTRARILEVATQEFAEHGSSGARVEKIAKAAGVNIRMIYYFFGSKRGLLDEVLSQIFRERRAQLEAARPATAEELLLAYFDGYAADPQRVRLLQWEALEAVLPEKANLLTNLEDRKLVIAERVRRIAELQAKGKIPGEFDPQVLYLMFVALSIYPMSYPQSVFVATGEHANSKDFVARYRKTLAALARRMFP